MKFKPLKEQTLVLTGATSGIGLVTARQAAKAGAKLVLAARDEASLKQICEEIEAQGGRAVYAVADVGDEAQVRGIAEKARAEFGGFDTWINNAGGAIYGLITEIPIADQRRMFETNFWGMVYGSLEAAREFKLRGENPEFAGVIINVGSADSDRAIPLQGMYATTKHAVRGFTDALRMELQHEKVPIALTLIKPAAIATPFPQHARNYMEREPSLPPPLYAPEIVAEAILKCASAPQRDVLVGGAAKQFSILGQYFPGLGDMLLGSKAMYEVQKRPEPSRDRPDALYEPGFGMQERGEFPGQHISESSPYTKTLQNPALKIALALGASAGVAALVKRRS